MRTTTDYLDALKARLGVSSDYQLSKVMKVRQSLISNYRTGRSHFDDAMAIEVAKTLEVDPGEVLAAMQAERTKCPAAKKAWRAISESLMAGLMACFIGVSGMAPAPSSAGTSVGQQTGNIYIMRTRTRRRKDAKKSRPWRRRVASIRHTRHAPGWHPCHLLPSANI